MFAGPYLQIKQPGAPCKALMCLANMTEATVESLRPLAKGLTLTVQVRGVASSGGVAAQAAGRCPGCSRSSNRCRPSSQVVESKVVVDKTKGPKGEGQGLKIAECIVGDATGTIIFKAKNEQGTLNGSAHEHWFERLGVGLPACCQVACGPLISCRCSCPLLSQLRRPRLGHT